MACKDPKIYLGIQDQAANIRHHTKIQSAIMRSRGSTGIQCQFLGNICTCGIVDYSSTHYSNRVGTWTMLDTSGLRERILLSTTK